MLRLEHDLLTGQRPCSCSQCDWQGDESELKHFRLSSNDLQPGDIVPAGACPTCRSKAYVLTEKTRTMMSSVAILELVIEAREHIQKLALYSEELTAWKGKADDLISNIFLHAGVSLTDFDQALFRRGFPLDQKEGEKIFSSLTPEEVQYIFSEAAQGRREIAVERIAQQRLDSSSS